MLSLYYQEGKFVIVDLITASGSRTAIVPDFWLFDTFVDGVTCNFAYWPDQEKYSNYSKIRQPFPTTYDGWNGWNTFSVKPRIEYSKYGLFAFLLK